MSYSENESFAVSLLLIIGFIIIQLLANLTVLKQTSFILGLVIPIGSLLWPLSYTWIDLINDYFGKERARLLVLAAVISNIIMIFWFKLYISIPGDNSWNSHPENQKAIELVLGGYWRIYIASIFTNLVCENLDITIFHYLKYNHPSIPRWARSAVSNTFSAPLDGFLFPIIAFVGIMPLNILISTIIASSLYKLFMAYIAIPLLYTVRSRSNVNHMTSISRM